MTRRMGFAAAVPRFEVDPSFPSLPAGKVLGDMSSVAVDAQDHVWMIHRPRTVAAEQRANAAPAVLEFDASGKFIAGWGGPAAGYEWPEREHGIHVDPAGSVWISGNNGFGTPPPPGNSDDMLLTFTTAGKFLLQIGHSGKSTGDADHDNVKQPADMHLFKPSNEIFVADGYGNHRVAVFDAGNGKFKRAWGANGDTPFNIVHSIRVSNDGLVYVADRGNKRVQVFTTAGAFKQQLTIGADTPAMQTREGRHESGRVRHRPRDRDRLEGKSAFGLRRRVRAGLKPCTTTISPSTPRAWPRGRAPCRVGTRHQSYAYSRCRRAGLRRGR